MTIVMQVKKMNRMMTNMTFDSYGTFTLTLIIHALV